MSHKLKTIDKLRDLQQTLAANSHIAEVHFTASGEHFFTAHELEARDEKGKVIKGGKKYGYLECEPQLWKVQGERKIFKMQPKHTPDAEIVETLSREDILALKVDVEKLSTKDQKALDKVLAENEALKAKSTAAGIE